METPIRVRVATFGSAAAALGWQTREFTVPVGETLAALVERIEHECPRLKEARGRVRYAVNLKYADTHQPLHDGDEIAVIPPVSGGSGESGPPREAARLVREPIDVPRLMREVEHGPIGAVAVFLGIVRPEADARGRTLRALEYSAYEPMALLEMNRLLSRACERHPLQAARIVHRLGVLALGDVSVAVVVSSPHRGEAFDACRELIEELKKFVPIFKREIWESGGSTWVDAI
jgi:molybdopterin synthase catalytic subunit